MTDRARLLGGPFLAKSLELARFSISLGVHCPPLQSPGRLFGNSDLPLATLTCKLMFLGIRGTTDPKSAETFSELGSNGSICSLGLDVNFLVVDAPVLLLLKSVLA